MQFEKKLKMKNGTVYWNGQIVGQRWGILQQK